MSLRDVIKLKKFTLEIQVRDLLKSPGFLDNYTCPVATAANRQMKTRNAAECVMSLDFDRKSGETIVSFEHLPYNMPDYKTDMEKAKKVRERNGNPLKVIRRIVMKRIL